MKDRSTLLIGGIIALVLGLALVMVPRDGKATVGSINGEFPADWFAPSTDEELAAQEKLLGKPMPTIELTDWRNGQRNSADLKGKVVVIDFWATWCAPCIAAFPANNTIYAAHKEKGLDFLGVCTNSGQDKYEKIISDKKPEYPIGRDEKLVTMNAWTTKTYPTYAIVDRKGNVRAIGLKHEYIEKVVEKLLSEQ